MEQNDVKYFDLVAGAEFLIEEVIADYNKDYATDFEIVEFDNRGGVLFAVVKFSKAKLDDVFQLGSFFGMRVQFKRDRKEINW
ncbi:MAG TPA: hypothetical protein VK518_15140 [Puia sp.]|nr:hypothetical protein [Puia sp.]